MSLLTHIILTYNDFDYLKRAVQNSLNQRGITAHEKEILIVDDGSVEAVEKPLRQLFDAKKHNIHFIRNRENLGIHKSVNLALDKVNSKYVYLGSSNDIILPDFFKESLEEIEKYPNAALSFSDPGIFEEQKNVYREAKLFLSKTPIFWEPDQLVNLYKKTPFHMGSNTVVLRTKLAKQVGMREDLGLYADWYLNYFLAFSKGCVYLPKNLTYLTIHENSYSIRSKKRNNAPLVRRFFECAQNESPQVFERLKKSGFISAFPLKESLLLLGHKRLRELFSMNILILSFKRALWLIVSSIITMAFKNKIRKFLVTLHRQNNTILGAPEEVDLIIPGDGPLC